MTRDEAIQMCVKLKLFNEEMWELVKRCRVLRNQYGRSSVLTPIYQQLEMIDDLENRILENCKCCTGKGSMDGVGCQTCDGLGIIPADEVNFNPANVVSQQEKDLESYIENQGSK